MRPGLTGVLLITLNVFFVYPSPINYVENNIAVNENTTKYSIPPTCVFGFEFNPTDGECHLALKLAGKVDKSIIDVFIICPSGYIYPGSGKLCIKRNRVMIDAPLVCPPGASLDRNGKCKESFK